MTAFRARWIVLFAAGAIAGGCSKKPLPVAERHYRFTGEVVRIDRKENLAVIHNQKVEGWMDPMTMEYPIRDSELNSLHPGDKITATVNVGEDGYWLSGVSVVQPATNPAH